VLLGGGGGGKGGPGGGASAGGSPLGAWLASLTESGMLPPSASASIKDAADGALALVGGCLGLEADAVAPSGGDDSEAGALAHAHGGGGGVDAHGKGAGFVGLTRRVMKHVLEDRNSRRILMFLCINVSQGGGC